MTDTIPLTLDGYTDLPPGKIANVVTFFEMTTPPHAPPPADPGRIVRKVKQPPTAWFRDLYRRIGEEWLWTSRAVMSDTALAEVITAPTTSLLAIAENGRDTGLAEIDFSGAGAAEIVSFGVIPEATGTGTAQTLMAHALRRAFGAGVSRVWLHTCTHDHPAAVRFYRKQGFRAFKYAVEVFDDPRQSGVLRRDAAPNVPLIEP